MKNFFITAAIVAATASLALSCRENGPESPDSQSENMEIRLEDIAVLLSELPIGGEQVAEVHDAVSSSTENGYDEEYTMCDLFASPGAGVGDSHLAAQGTKSEGRSYSSPIKDMISDYLFSSGTKAGSQFNGLGGDISPDKYLEALKSSDVQIYWPYYENWDGKSHPVITFDPGDGSETNVGYRTVVTNDGGRRVEEVEVTEKMARETAVWVVNRNDDSRMTSLEMLRRQDPDWGTGGGEIIIGKRPADMYGLRTADAGASGGVSSKAGNDKFRTLIIKNFTAYRNYDSWFAGASEFFVRCGSVESFRAKTEDDLKLYKPSITDFMIVVRRCQIGNPVKFNAVLVSDWTDQLESCGFMITEDDGGTRDEWKCSAVGKLNSKSYGFEVSLPFHTRDDIVWRGQLAGKYFEKYNNVQGRFGDVGITFEIIETD